MGTLGNSQVYIAGVIINKMKRSVLSYGYPYYYYEYYSYRYYGVSEADSAEVNGPDLCTSCQQAG